MKCVALIVWQVLTLAAAQQRNIVGYEEPEIVDILNQTLPGQCLVPSICLDKYSSCGESQGDHHVVVNCTHRQAGPYVPFFQPYILPRRTWDLDFSYNGIVALDSSSFMVGQITVNLTRLVISNNYINSVAPDTFRGEVSRVLEHLDLSYNKLKELKDGTFDDMPALETLLLGNNKLLNIDPLCKTAFAQLTTLDVEYNRVSSLSLQCLSGSSKTVRLNLDANYIGSVDDCSYSDKIELQMSNVPVLCGCSTKLSGAVCLQLNTRTNTTSRSTQPSCSASTTCSQVAFGLTYDWVDGGKGLYNITLEIEGDEKHTIEVLQYTNLRNESVSARLLESGTATSQFTSTSIDVSKETSVCVTPLTDSEHRHRRCAYLDPPYYYSSTSSYTTVTLTTLLSAVLVLVI